MTLGFWTFLSLNLVPVCIKIFNSEIVFGLYYGFISSFSMGPSFLFLSQALAREEAIEKKAATMSGTLMGQLIMFISIFYAPLHLVLGQSNTLSVLSLSYLLLNFCNHKNFFGYGSANQGSIGNGKIVVLFLSNLIFQCLNHFFFPSAVIYRLINVYVFRSNKKMLFLTSSFAGWLFGWVAVYLFFGKCLGSVVLWIRENHSIRSHKFIRYVVAKFRNSRTGIFRILLVINCAYLLSRISFPIKPSRKKAEIAVEIETADEEDPSSSLFLEERADDSKQIDETEEIRANRSENDENSRILPKKPAKKDLFFFDKILVPLLFDSNQWNRPLRYIKNEKLEQAVRNEMGNSFCSNCVSDGKERIAFSFPPSVSIFRERVQRKMDSFVLNLFRRHLEGMTTLPAVDLHASWVSRNKKKEKQAKKEFLNRIKSIETKYSFVNSLETRTRLCNDDSTNQYLPKIYDPFLRGPCRKTIDKNASPKNILKKTFIQNFGINRLQQFLIGYSDIPGENFDREEEEMFWSQNFTYAKDRIKELEEKINLKKKKKELWTRDTCIEKYISRGVDTSYFLIKNNAKFCVAWMGVVIGGNILVDIWGIGKALLTPPFRGWKMTKHLGQLVLPYTKKFLLMDLKGESFCNFRYSRVDFTYWRLGRIGKLFLEIELRIVENDFLNKINFRFDYKNLGLSLGVLRFLDKFYYQNKQNKDNMEVKTEEEELELEKWIKVKEKLEKEDRERKLVFAKRAILLADASSEKRNRRKNQINEISQKIPKWEYKLITELEQQELFEEVAEDFEIRSREAKEVVVFKAIKEDKDDPDQIEELTTTRYLEQPDFDRDIIKGSVRAQRRKVGVWKVFQGNAHSPLFLSRIKKSILFSLPAKMFELIQSSIRNRVRKGEIVESLNEQTKREENRIEIEDEEELQILEEGDRIKIAESWDNFHPYAQGIRAGLLLIQSIFRKYILLPSFIIAKNVGRICLSQGPEWSDDFREWKRELHIICTYNGVPLSETELPPEWFIEGLQVRIVFPFRLKPWHNRKLRSFQEKEEFCFLTVFGLEAKHPFGFAEKRPSFWKPVLKQLGKRVGKMKKNYFKGKKKRLAKVSKENPIQLREVEIYESQEIPEEKDFTSSNPLINQSFSQTGSPGLTNSSLTEKKIKDLTERIGTIRKQIERIRNKKRKNDTSGNKTFNAQILAKWKIVKRRILRFISKFPLYLKFLIALISRHIFLSSTEWKLSGVWKFLLNSSYFAIQTRLRLTKNRIEKSLDLINSNKMNKKKKNPISFKKSLDNIRHMKSHLHNFFDLSCVSQAYVFYQLSQMEVSNLHKFRSVLQYEGISLFLKPEIKDSLEKQGLVHSKFKLDPKKLRNSKKNQWKNWLRGYYPYNLSSISWSRLMPEKWRNTCHQPCTDKKEKLSKWNSYETDRVFDYKKKWEVPKLANQKENVQKSYRYDLLADKFLNSEKCKEKMDGFTFQGNKNRDPSWNTHKDPLSDIMTTYNSVDMLAVEKMVNRKYLRLKSFSRYRRKKVDIESCITIDSNRNPTIQRETNNYLKISRQDAYSESEIGYFRLPDNRSKFHKVVLDWMGMNEEMLNYSISNLEGWFFPEFVLFHQAYKLKPWFRPNQLLLFNLNRNENSIENKKRKCKKKQENQEEPLKGEDLGSVLSQEKSSEENDVKLDKKKKKKKKSQLDFFLERYLLFQLKWRNSTMDEKMMNNIDAYCLLLRLIDPSEMFVSLIQTREIDLDIMIPSSLTHAEFLTKAILVIEPIRLFGKIDGQFLMYQTISTSLVDKSKYETNPKYQEERYVSKKHIDFLIPENIFSFRRRRKLRILISLNSKYRNDENRNRVFGKGKNRKNSNQASPENKGLNREENALMKLKLFLWPNYRLEDLACMNRYWFNTNNGSRFGMLRIHLYPRLKISRY
nr:hypothetical chloroplast RF19 [Plantago crassifolia]QWL16019.1 hypothetical chloroplast RF19 [Plantago crassifolia]